jgi:hypothetical protein
VCAIFVAAALALQCESSLFPSMRHRKNFFRWHTRAHFLPLFKYRNHQYTCFCARCAPQYNFDPHSFQWRVGAITPRMQHMSSRFLPQPDAELGKTYTLDIIPHTTFHFDVRSLSAAAAARYTRVKSELRRYVLIEVCKCSFRSLGEITGEGREIFVRDNSAGAHT